MRTRVPRSADRPVLVRATAVVASLGCAALVATGFVGPHLGATWANGADAPIATAGGRPGPARSLGWPAAPTARPSTAAPATVAPSAATPTTPGTPAAEGRSTTPTQQVARRSAAVSSARAGGARLPTATPSPAPITPVPVTPAPSTTSSAPTSAAVSTTFRIATYNVLGSQHAAGGVARVQAGAGLLLDRGIDIVGLQEVQKDQRAALAAAMPGYAVWPQDALGPQGYRAQIMYRTDRFGVLGGGSVTYPFDSQQVPMPYARMVDRQTGAEFYLVDSHNSARDLEAERDEATRIEIDLVHRLEATGLPVVMTIDANEHTEFFCAMTTATGMVSANGGYADAGCHLPGGPLRIDWILGGGMGSSSVQFSGYRQDDATLRSHISDHYLLYADAVVLGPPAVL